MTLYLVHFNINLMNGFMSLKMTRMTKTVNEKIKILVIQDLPEQSLQVLRQLGTARVPRVHGDEHTDGGDEGNQLPEEIELRLLGLNSV